MIILLTIRQLIEKVPIMRGSRGRVVIQVFLDSYSKIHIVAPPPTPSPKKLSLGPCSLGKKFWISAYHYTITIVIWTEHLSLLFHNHNKGDILKINRYFRFLTLVLSKLKAASFFYRIPFVQDKSLLSAIFCRNSTEKKILKCVHIKTFKKLSLIKFQNNDRCIYISWLLLLMLFLL